MFGMPYRTKLTSYDTFWAGGGQSASGRDVLNGGRSATGTDAELGRASSALNHKRRQSDC